MKTLTLLALFAATLAGPALADRTTSSKVKIIQPGAIGKPVLPEAGKKNYNILRPDLIPAFAKFNNTGGATVCVKNIGTKKSEAHQVETDVVLLHKWGEKTQIKGSIVMFPPIPPGQKFCLAVDVPTGMLVPSDTKPATLVWVIPKASESDTTNNRRTFVTYKLSGPPVKLGWN